MKNYFAAVIAILAWVAVFTQYYLMINNRTTSIGEATVRFFSYFTILTNTLVAVYFSWNITKQNKTSSMPNNSGTLTAVTVYITVVGLIYQVILRHTWSPTGLQKITDELLHSVVPILVIVFWYFYENKTTLRLRQIPRWLIYPLIYLIYILIRGSFSHFYPYPFVNVDSIGLNKVLVNSTMITVLFIALSAAFVAIGTRLKQVTK